MAGSDIKNEPIADFKGDPLFLKGFKCRRCDWTEPHGHRGTLAMSIKDLTTRGASSYVKVDHPSADGLVHDIQLTTLEEHVKELQAMLGPEGMEELIEQMKRARQDYLNAQNKPK